MTNSSFVSDSLEMIAREKARLEADHNKRKTTNKDLWSGVALSGGGIRSAAFALGAVQALAAKDVFGKFDYVSSVSGGSYLSSSLQWW